MSLFMSYPERIDEDYPHDARYEYHIKKSFSGQQQRDLMWLYLQMHRIDDTVDSHHHDLEHKKCKASEHLSKLLSSEMFAKLETFYGVRAEDLQEMTSVLLEMLSWTGSELPFHSYEEMEAFNFRLMSSVARSVSPVIFHEILSKNKNHMVRAYYDDCFTQHMMAMQIVNLVKDVDEDKNNNQIFFPKTFYAEKSNTLDMKHLLFLKEKGDVFLARAVALRDPMVGGACGAQFVQGLTHIYSSLFEALILN